MAHMTFYTNVKVIAGNNQELHFSYVIPLTQTYFNYATDGITEEEFNSSIEQLKEAAKKERNNWNKGVKN